jgi:putative copper export protein
MTRSDLVRLVAATVEMLAAGIWLGGLLVLGAIVAPTIFREVSAPESADAMTLVFTRFDRVAMTASAVVAVAEVVRLRSALAASAPSRVDALRMAVIALAGGLAMLQGLWLSPVIVALHREGAIRGLGPLGERLERFHGWSEACGKTEVALLVLLIALVVHAVRKAPVVPA